MMMFEFTSILTNEFCKMEEEKKVHTQIKTEVKILLPLFFGIILQNTREQCVYYLKYYESWIWYEYIRVFTPFSAIVRILAQIRYGMKFITLILTAVCLLALCAMERVIAVRHSATSLLFLLFFPSLSHVRTHVLVFVWKKIMAVKFLISNHLWYEEFLHGRRIEDRAGPW